MHQQYVHRGCLASAGSLILPTEANQSHSETVPHLYICNFHTDSEAQYSCVIPALRGQCEWGYSIRDTLTMHTLSSGSTNSKHMFWS